MIHIITIVGILICGAALVGLAAPATLTSMAASVAESERLRVAVTVSRLLFGGIAILAANATHYPLTMKIIGVAAIMAGTALATINRETLKTWMGALSGRAGVSRLMSLLALLFGGFLLHATL